MIRAFLLLPAALSILVSCEKVVIIVEDIPTNTPQGAEIHISGNFNYWDPGDENFTLQQYSDGVYGIAMPTGMGNINFNFTRGDWTTVEGDLCGNSLEARSFSYGQQDTLFLSIQSWKDQGPLNCPQVTFFVKHVPETTLESDTIFIAGNFNGWEPGKKEYALKSTQNGHAITIDFDEEYPRIEYKFTRGDWSKTEADEIGIEMQKRTFLFGTSDTVFVDIAEWTDIGPADPNQVTIIVNSIPANTPEFEPIYLVGSFNGWYPRDINYTLSMNQLRQPFITVTVPAGGMEYKFTRGSWNKVEGDSQGNRLPDRTLPEDHPDTVYVQIETWEDLYEY